MNTYRRFLDAKLPVPEDVRLTRNIAYNELYGITNHRHPSDEPEIARLRKAKWRNKQKELKKCNTSQF